MKVRRALTDLVRVIADEAEKNIEFNARLCTVLRLLDETLKASRTKLPSDSLQQKSDPAGTLTKRASNRRPPAMLDPVALARQGEDILRAELGKLELEQLLDVVAEYGMDTGKLVMKWRNADRVINRIVEMSNARAQKGNAFRDQTDSNQE